MTLASPAPSAPSMRVAGLVSPWAIAAGGILLALVVALLVFPASSAPPLRAWPFIVVTIAFFVTETVSLHVEFRRQAWAWSVSEFALTIALVEIGGGWAAVARAIGLGLSLAVQRYSPAKALFNIAVATAEVAVAVAVLEILPFGDLDDPASWLSLIIAVLVADIVGTPPV